MAPFTELEEIALKLKSRWKRPENEHNLERYTDHLVELENVTA